MGTALLAVATALVTVSAGKPSQLPPKAVNLTQHRTQEQCSTAVADVLAKDLKSLAFPEVEALIGRGWWGCVKDVIVKGHEVRADFTTAVRRAIGEAKHEADDTLNWVDKDYAFPESMPMVFKWAQNETTVMLLGRFAPGWDSPGAKLAVFSNEGGRHFDPDATRDLVKSLLNVSITRDRFYADITAATANTRKRYTMDIPAFGALVPERSKWEIGLAGAAGSMQMSKGAAIPELRVFLKKLFPFKRPWQRLTITAETEAALHAEFGPWASAPGHQQMWEVQLKTSSHTCTGNSIYCPTADKCVESCAACAADLHLATSGLRCIQALRTPTLNSVQFEDQDLAGDSVGGKLVFSKIPQDISLNADFYEARWALDKETPVQDVEPLMHKEANFDTRIVLKVPNGTKVPGQASYIVFYAINPGGQVVMATAQVKDRAVPPPPRGLKFDDTDSMSGLVTGIVEIKPAEDETFISSYEVRFGETTKNGGVKALMGAPLAKSWSSKKWTQKTDTGNLKIEVGEYTAVAVPKGATHILAYSLSGDGLRSVPVPAKFVDLGGKTKKSR
eukprot:gnl/TRDRNA2_/TRDRNA2_92117_c0_seq1.p1 gnl/TRDRNA2_/TRDRNA2_92117_c0~~gnl/TRDRNA2_/TRDRNA2_92117_c0_seq1.p1  ORF type:complete len:572 (-),score=103.89 gnl/TRDRNA2_/TRDRNA2_92117_c0_seq1:61-1743(-)